MRREADSRGPSSVEAQYVNSAAGGESQSTGTSATSLEPGREAQGPSQAPGADTPHKACGWSMRLPAHATAHATGRDPRLELGV
ncbi:hypothetical protein CC85DRAFT_281420 [Cutaneotrichosporon oleaginosum]|uniref:Uncharacterized protein n=1 Tax=Cutaneotrichosporon oleaginosum TaxID=879819 RepID=A0A0J0XZ49_9TREE|nr:uncharacterized protein CC85DRAFT_281420 [Cutaneotrichosporon oleaginosum]KLT46332.1 hypothetical protein CC85DRAFT_281420 [Cutaneotrichosporon oleaginosum]TXT15296.1 hypothetical protein COLE_01489 [Cutaneotrichosporon oleaginosum]